MTETVLQQNAPLTPDELAMQVTTTYWEARQFQQDETSQTLFNYVMSTLDQARIEPSLDIMSNYRKSLSKLGVTHILACTAILNTLSDDDDALSRNTSLKLQNTNKDYSFNWSQSPEATNYLQTLTQQAEGVHLLDSYDPGVYLEGVLNQLNSRNPQTVNQIIDGSGITNNTDPIKLGRIEIIQILQAYNEQLISAVYQNAEGGYSSLANQVPAPGYQDLLPLVPTLTETEVTAHLQSKLNERVALLQLSFNGDLDYALSQVGSEGLKQLPFDNTTLLIELLNGEVSSVTAELMASSHGLDLNKTLYENYINLRETTTQALADGKAAIGERRAKIVVSEEPNGSLRIKAGDEADSIVVMTGSNTIPNHPEEFERNFLTKLIAEAGVSTGNYHLEDLVARAAQRIFNQNPLFTGLISDDPITFRSATYRPGYDPIIDTLNRNANETFLQNIVFSLRPRINFTEIMKLTGNSDPIPFVNNLEARIATHRAITEHFGANQVVMFDDTAFAVPEDQQQHLAALPGYERALLPAMMFALSGVNTSLIVTAPPLPIELAYALGIYQENGGNVNLMQLLYANPITGENVNLLNLNQDEYLELMSEYYAFIQTPQGEVTKKDTFRHAHAVNKLLEDGLISGDNPTLVMPFQTTEAHYSYAQEHDWMNNGVKLLDNASNVRDKIVLYQALKDQGIVPDFRAVLATADSKGQQYLHLNDLPESEKDEAITDYATRVIQATMELEAVHGGAFIKLDSIGVSGIANVSTKAYPDVYNQDLGLVERVTALKAAIVEKKIHVLTDAVIEQFVEIEQDPVYGELEFTISGFALDGTYMPWAVDKFQTEDGTYVSNYQANTAEQLGISAEDAKALYTIVNQAVTALKQAGLYSDGYIAFDVFRNKSTGKWMIHDPNLRRGGRSVLEAQVVMDRENKTRPIFNKEYMMQVSGAFLTEAEAHANMPTNPMQTISDRITNMKTELGDPQIGLYGTGFTYFPKLMQLQNGTWCWAVKSKLLMGLDPLKRTSEQSQQSEERLSIIGAADKLAAQYGAVL